MSREYARIYLFDVGEFCFQPHGILGVATGESLLIGSEARVRKEEFCRQRTGSCERPDDQYNNGHHDLECRVELCWQFLKLALSLPSSIACIQA